MRMPVGSMDVINGPSPLASGVLASLHSSSSSCTEQGGMNKCSSIRAPRGTGKQAAAPEVRETRTEYCSTPLASKQSDSIMEMELDELLAGKINAAAASPTPPTGSTGVLFTAAQWVELQRQVLFYRHMAASAPIPSYLLFSAASICSNATAIAYAPTTTSSSCSYYNGAAQPQLGQLLPPDYYGYHYQARMSMLLQRMQQQAVARRCRRTDGKKWRCARDAAPDQKYCHRHLHRAGRPRPAPPASALRKQQQQHPVPAPAAAQTCNDHHAAAKSNDYTMGAVAGLPEQRENRLSLNYDDIMTYHSGAFLKQPSPISSICMVDDDAIAPTAAASPSPSPLGPLGEVLARYATPTSGMQWPGSGGYV